MHGLMRSHFVIAFLVRRVDEIPNRLVSIHEHYDDTPSVHSSAIKKLLAASTQVSCIFS